MEPIYNIFGLKRSGKDTIAEILKKQFGYRHLAFADPLREVVSAAYPYLNKLVLTGNEKESPIERLKINAHAKECYPELLGNFTHWSPRLLLQFLGTDIFRDFISDSTWVDTMKFYLLNLDIGTVITDCRFPNEYELLNSKEIKEKYEVVNILVERPSTESKDLHQSEKHVKSFKYDIKIDNSGTLEDLRLSLFDALYPETCV